MKILLVNNLYAPNRVGGAERSVQLLAEGLLEAGHEPVVVTLTTEESRRVDVVDGVRVVRVPLRNLYWPYDNVSRSSVRVGLWYLLDAFNPAYLGPFREVLRREEPDLVHTHNLMGFSPSVWAMASDYPLVHTIRDYYLVCLRSTRFRGGDPCETTCRDCRVAKFPNRLLDGLPDHLVGISQQVIDRHRREALFGDGVDSTVIYNPIEEGNSIESTDTSSTTIPEEPAGLTLGFLGQLNPNKGIEWLLEEFVAVDRPNVRLLVGGEDTSEYARDLKQRFRGEDIHFLGYVDPDDFYPAIDLLVVPSRWEEPMGRVVPESYSYGVPVLASNRGGLPEVVEPGETGYLFEPSNPEEFRELVGELAANPDQVAELGSCARRHTKDFDLETHVRRHVEVYESLLPS